MKSGSGEILFFGGFIYSKIGWGSFKEVLQNFQPSLIELAPFGLMGGPKSNEVMASSWS